MRYLNQVKHCKTSTILFLNYIKHNTNSGFVFFNACDAKYTQRKVSLNYVTPKIINAF